VYSVISPEGCAAILWKDASQRERAAAALRLTAEDLLELGIVDAIVPEPPGGAHADPDETSRSLHEALRDVVGELRGTPPAALVSRRREKYLGMGRFEEV